MCASAGIEIRVKRSGQDGVCGAGCEGELARGDGRG